MAVVIITSKTSICAFGSVEKKNALGNGCEDIIKFPIKPY